MLFGVYGSFRGGGFAIFDLRIRGDGEVARVAYEVAETSGRLFVGCIVVLLALGLLLDRC